MLDECTGHIFNMFRAAQHDELAFLRRRCYTARLPQPPAAHMHQPAYLPAMQWTSLATSTTDYPAQARSASP